jgi:hypothetical protein
MKNRRATMTEVHAVAISPDKTHLVLKKGEHYGVIDRREGITEDTHWTGKHVVSSKIMKGGYKRFKTPKKYKGLPDKVEKSRKSVESIERTTKKKPSKQQQLIIDLGLGDVAKDLVSNVVTRKSQQLIIDLNKADNAHLPKSAERFSYKCDSNYNIVYIPVNRLKQVYQTEDAINPATVQKKMNKMKAGVSMPPVFVGYDYDVHDGHHIWKAADKAGYTHVPCKVVGNDPKKVKEAIAKYKDVWKSLGALKVVAWEDLGLDKFVESLKGNSTNSPSLFIDENKQNDAVDEKILPVNEVAENVPNAVSEIPVEKSMDVSIVLDLNKSLNRGKLIKKRTMVKGTGGKVFYRMQWVDPNDKSAGMEHPGVDHSTFSHHEDGIKDMEKRQSNRFPVVHHPTKDLKNTDHNYSVDKEKYADAEKKYKSGEKLPPVKVNPKGEVLDNHHLVDLAKKHGLSHVPTVVTGNPELKKKLEDKLKDKTVTKDEDGNIAPMSPKEPERSTEPNQGESADMVTDVEHFKKFTSKKYTKEHLMNAAKDHGLEWKTTMNDGTDLPGNSAILWMHAHKAIVNHIKAGNQFQVGHSEKDVTKRMGQDGKDNIHKHFLKLMEKHGSKGALTEWARENGISWKEQEDPSINWKNVVVAIKKELALGKMVDGVRTRQKDAMKEANTVVTDQIKSMVKALGSKYGKLEVMNRADEMGLEYSKITKKGDTLPSNSNILWMRAHEAVSKHIAQGGEFKMAGQEDTGIVSQTGDYGEAPISKHQGFALDLAKRNSQNLEDKLKKWAIKALITDRDIDESQAGELYKQFMEKSRDRKVLVHFDPLELLPSGTTLLDQLSSDGEFKNDYALDRGLDREHREANESGMFGEDFNDAEDKERPTYGVADMFNQGLASNTHNGEVAFVLKSGTKKRITGSATDSNSIPYGEDGKHVRSMEDPHHLIIDRWRSRWKNVNKKDSQRTRMFDSVLEGTTHHDDTNMFETHVHGGLKFDRDVDHILVPQSWKSDSQHKEKHEQIKNFAGQFGMDVKYEG